MLSRRPFWHREGIAAASYMEVEVTPTVSRPDCEGGKQITEELDQPILPAIKPCCQVLPVCLRPAGIPALMLHFRCQVCMCSVERFGIRLLKWFNLWVIAHGQQRMTKFMIKIWQVQ